MNLDWYISQILNISWPTVFTSIGGSYLVKECWDWRKSRNLQKQQADYNRELEHTKKECQREIQAHHLKIQFQITSLYKIYPELYEAFTITQGRVYQLFYHSWDYQNVFKNWCELTKILAKHSLFLDDHLSDVCVVTKDLLFDGIKNYNKLSKEDKEKHVSDVQAKMNEIKKLMRINLNYDLNITKNFPENGKTIKEINETEQLEYIPVPEFDV